MFMNDYYSWRSQRRDDGILAAPCWLLDAHQLINTRQQQASQQEQHFPALSNGHLFIRCETKPILIEHPHWDLLRAIFA
jgi:hypothetical protein